MKQTKAAFTIVELLIVIAIIAVLVAILIPLFGNARGHARQSGCAGNMKQLAMAMLQYAQDHDQRLPVGVDFGPAKDAGGMGAGWAGQLYPYVKNTAAFACPDDKTMVKAEDEYVMSYAINTDCVRLSNGGHFGVGGQLSKMTAPARTVLLVECQGVSADPTIDGEGFYANRGADLSAATDGNPDFQARGRNQPYQDAHMATGTLGGQYTVWPARSTEHYGWGIYPAAGSPGANGRHSGGSNFALCDGHVQYFSPTQVSPGVMARFPRAPQSSNGTPDAAGTQGYFRRSGAPQPDATFSPI